MGIIYCYTNLQNGKRYIGQTINPEQRKKQHYSSAFNPNDADYNAVIHKAFRKYGYENFEYRILAFDIEDLNILNLLEEYYIQSFNTKVPFGYNVLDGGLNASKPKSEITKEKLMRAKMELSEEEIIQIREAYSKKESPKRYYEQHYKDKMHYNSFLNIWSGRKYQYIKPELIEKGRHTKLNAELVKQIRKERQETNLSYQKLADKFNISKATIADVVNYRTWKEVQLEPVSTSLESET